MFDSCETETPEFPKVFGRVYFNDGNDDAFFSANGQPYGIVSVINYANNFVKVWINGNKEIEFELDGSSWSKCGQFKREMWNYQGESETCANEF